VKILIHSNSPANGTGYGQQVAQLAPRLIAAGHEVAISAMTGANGGPSEWDGILCYPPGMQPFSSDVIGFHARHFFGGGPGLVLILYDAWCMDPAATAGLATAIWTPVHSKGLSAGDRAFFSMAQVLPIAMSRHGERVLSGTGLDVRYAPHGIDCTTFRPLDQGQRDAVREALNIPLDAFLVTMVAANKGKAPNRKAFAESLQAFAKFRKRHPEARLFLHTLMSRAHGGIALVKIIQQLGLTDAVHFSEQYPLVSGLFGADYVAGVMGASDVFLNPSMGEGFGLPSVEAQACGIPVITGDNSAQPELFGAGWLTECQPYWEDDDETWWATPLVKAISSNLSKAHQHARDPGLRVKAREFAERFDADLVFAEYWKPLLDMLEQYAGARQVTIPRPGEIPLPVREADGLKWIQRGGHTDDWIAIDHEDNLAPVLDEMLPEDGVFVDVGAHVGRWSLRLARKASRVVAVEANPSTAAVLRAHLNLNQVANVGVMQLAAWDEETRMNLRDPKGVLNSGSTQVVEAEDEDHGDTWAAPLDTVLAGESRIDLVKIDVEGADLHVLAGMAGLIEKHRPKLLIERHDIYGYYEYDDLKAAVEALGYLWREVNILIGGGNALAPYLAAEPDPAGEYDIIERQRRRDRQRGAA